MRSGKARSQSCLRSQVVVDKTASWQEAARGGRKTENIVNMLHSVDRAKDQESMSESRFRSGSMSRYRRRVGGSASQFSLDVCRLLTQFVRSRSSSFILRLKWETERGESEIFMIKNRTDTSRSWVMMNINEQSH